MAITTYSELKTAIASWLHRDDLTSTIDDFIDLTEADMQVRAKLSQWDTSATVTLTSGVGSLPSDFAAVKSVTYPAGDYTLAFQEQEGFDEVAAGAESGEPVRYMIRGASLYVYPLYSGDVTVAYTARFTPLSASATTNSLLTLFPDAYMQGAMMHAAIYLSDDASLQKHQMLFEQALTRIRTYMLDYKYPNGLFVRTA